MSDTEIDPARSSPSGRRPTPLGVGSAVVLVFGGVILGLFGGFLQAWTVPVAGIALPVGLVLVLACLLAGIRALIHLFDSRRAGVVFFVGWVVTSVVLAIPTSEGDIVIAPDGLALVYLFVGVIAGSAAANIPARLRPVTPDPTSMTSQAQQ